MQAQLRKDMFELGTSPETIEKDIADLEADLLPWKLKASGKQPITLRQARLNNHMSLGYVAGQTGLTLEQLEAYEEDSGPMEMSYATMLCKLYKLSINHVYFGKTPSMDNAMAVRDEFSTYVVQRLESSNSIFACDTRYVENDKKIPELIRDLMEKLVCPVAASILLDLEAAYNETTCFHEINAYHLGFKDAIKMFA